MKQDLSHGRKVEVCKLPVKQRNKKTVRIDCNTCTFSTHAEGNCPATELECYECRKTRHYSSSKACKYSDKKKKKKKRVSRPEV